VLLAAVVYLATRFIVNIPQGNIGIVERRWLGKKLPPGRVYATDGEIGIEAAYLLPGPHLMLWPVRRLIKTEPFQTIGPDELGYITATDGAELPPGRIFAEDPAGAQHKNFEDPVGFLTGGGIRGPQLRVVNSGQLKLHPFLFKIEKRAKKRIREGFIGIVTARDGAVLASGQIVGKSIEGHDSFQQAEVFLRNGGQKGPQVDYLRPGGTFNINEWVFTVEERKVQHVPDDFIGVVTAIGGRSLTKNDVVAATPDPDLHHYFQDGQKFLDNGGMRGPQEIVLPPGDYYIGFLFEVEVKPAKVVAPGTVAVVVSYIGMDPAKLENPTVALESPPEGAEPVPPAAPDRKLDSGVHQVHVVPDGYRGVRDKVLGPAKYNLNPLAYLTIDVPTTTATMEWSGAENRSTRAFDPFEVLSNDGYTAKIDIEFNYRIAAEKAPYVISKVGSIAALERDVIHPLVAGIVRVQVSSSPAIAYMQERAKEQESALVRLREALEPYGVEAVQLLITNCELDKDLMETVKAKNIAELRKATLGKEQEAEEARVSLEQTKGRANQQARLAEAEIGIQVATHEAQQARVRADGEAAAVETVGLARAKVTEATGRAQGVAYNEQKAALGQAGLTAVEALKLIAEGKIKITPDNLVMSGNGGDGGGTLNGLVALLLTGAFKNGGDETPPAEPGKAA
jgi:uncharacterized membrane protein YqiK